MRAMHGPIKFEMSLEEAMLTQRAIRRLKDDLVDDALVLPVTAGPTHPGLVPGVG